ncbi:MAG: hypothetical protein AAGE52_33425 [Myxococcota bacterium]
MKFVVLNAIAWAALLGGLGIAGHAPSGPLLIPVPREHYYLFEAIAVVPVHVAMALALIGVSHAVASRMGGTGTRSALTPRLALAMAGPSFFFWWLPDVVVVLAYGFETLAPAMRVYVPVAMVVTLVLSAVAIRQTHELSIPQATAAAFLGLIAHAVIGMPILR